MKTYALAAQKGGTAKTTTCYTLAIGLANRGYRVLAIDADPQCNFSTNAGLDVLETDYSVYDVLKGTATAKQAAQIIKIGLSVIPGSLQLATADMEFVQTGRELMLKKALQGVQEDYDYCFVDTSPHLGILTQNALAAADRVIIPITPDMFALQGLVQLQGCINAVREYFNQNLTISGLLVTRNNRTRATAAVMDAMDGYAEMLGTKVFKTKIRESTTVRESQLLQADLFSEYPKAEVTHDYEKFIDELLESEG